MGIKLECREPKGKDTKGWIICNDGKKWIYVDRSNKNKTHKLLSTPFFKFCKDVFLPQGFPESVHSDYVPYQIWDSVQAFASTILGTLTTHSIMRGIGVGDSTATPLAAAVTWILRDGTGMIGRIVFAWWNGPELDAQCKKWRLFADVLNDVAMGIELAVPYFSSHATAMLCISSGMKSLVGVAGGATRAAITQHQALSNNLADVSAKDASQETCVNLIGSLVGIFILTYLNVSSVVEICYVILVAVHIYANYSAVKSLCFETFNENRLALVVKTYLTRGLIVSPEKINQRESLAFFRRPSKELCGFDIVIGHSLENAANASIAYTNINEEVGDYIIPDVKTRTIHVALENDATPSDIINAYAEAFFLGIFLSMNMNLRLDIIREANAAVGPLVLLYNITSMSEDGIESLATLLDRERAKFSELLNISEWKQEVNLLSIGPYRTYEDDK